MANLTKPVTLNGWGNLATLMKNAGYTGANMVSDLRIFNPDGTNLLYIHLTDNGASNPATGTDGWPIGGAAGAADKSFSMRRDSNLSSLDLGTTWLFTGASVTFKVLAVGN